MAEKRRRSLSLHDPIIVTGLYLILFAVLSVASDAAAGISSESADVVADMLLVVSSLATVAAAALTAALPLLVVLAFVLPAGAFAVDTYFLLGPGYQETVDFLFRFDFWSFLAVALLNIHAYFRRDLSKPQVLALAGWSVFVFGNALLLELQQLDTDLPFFIPVVAALALWIPALWTGSRRPSSP